MFIGKNILHFLHIGKAGGTAIKEAMKGVVETKKYIIRLHPHKTKLRDIPENEKVFFFLRDPVTRFVSGFNSRLRQGLPRYNSPWSEGEKIAFQHFPTANKLAESLFETHQQKIVEQAMADIRHINQTYAYWFDNIEYISSRIKDLIFVGFQETFNSDFEILKELLQLPKNIIVPQDDIKSHKTPKVYDNFLSDKAIKNLKKWYRQDYEFIHFIKKYKRRILVPETANMTKKYAKKNDPKVPSPPDNDANDLIDLLKDSDKLLEQTQSWTPPIPPWQPLKKNHNSSLRMACLLGDRLYQGLSFEGEILLLNPANWGYVLRHGRPDFLLMESIWNTATGHWHMGQCPGSPGRDELLEIVSLAAKLSIPSLFWITKGHEYHEHYKDFARQFDYVFCADPKEADLLRSEGIKADELLPCVQPAIYNPFRHYDYYDTFNLGILYDGWADLDRMTDDLNVLKEVKPYGLDIIESRYQIFRQRKEVLQDYKECILGCVSEQSRIQAMRYAKAYITLEKTLSTKTTQQWMTLEAAASRLPVVHHGALSKNDLRKGLIVECPEQRDFLVEFVRFQEDDLYRERVAHLGWRKAYQEHTFSHRIEKICKTIGIQHDWEEYPKASLITPTFRRESLQSCMKTYEQQTYPNKELVLVFNGPEAPSYKELGLNRIRNDVKIANVPGEMFAGACLNHGILIAEGEYCLRIDDDDYYGANYILDMILQAKSIDCDLFGKCPAPLLFEDDQTLYIRENAFPFCVVPGNLFSNGKLWLGGNSIAGKKGLFQKVFFQDNAYVAADTSLMYNSNINDVKTCAFLDDLNLVAMRRSDQSTHTWVIKEDSLKEQFIKSGFIEERMI